MAYFPKNKAKVKPAKKGEFIYFDDKTPFNGTYIQTSKGQFYEGEDINFPGRVIIPTEKRNKKNELLTLLFNFLKGALIGLAAKLLGQLLSSLKGNLENPGDKFNVEQAEEIINNANDANRDLTEQEQDEINNLLSQIDYDKVPLDNLVISNSNYNNLKPGIFNKLSKTKSITSTKIRPTDKDYVNGSYLRYFTRRNNALGEFSEINKSTYDSIASKKSTFDINLYQAFSIKWDLGENAQETNTNILARYERALPGIQNLFSNPTEYAQVVRTNLFTEGNELYFENGIEYIGEYHIHPLQGPMVGPIHVSRPHKKLYYSYELGTPKNESAPQEIPLETQQTGLFKTIGGNEYYIKENKFGIYAEVIDTISEPSSVIYTSRIYLKMEISPEDLIDLAVKEVGRGSIKIQKLPQKFGDNPSLNTKTSLRRATEPSSTPQPTSQPTPPPRGRGGY